MSTEEDMRPVWLLDVDGVINAARPIWGAAPRHAHATAFGQSWRLTWAPGLVELLRSWHREGRVELRWATTWCPWAAQLEDLWGLPPLVRSLTEGEVANRHAANRAKLLAALAVVEEERRPLVWTDDEAIPLAVGRERDFWRRLTTGPMPAHMVAPKSRCGLTRGEMREIDAFLADLSAPASHRGPAGGGASTPQR